MRNHTFAASLTPAVRLEPPEIDHPYPGLSLDLADVVAGPGDTLLATWCDAEERLSQEYAANCVVASAERSPYRIEVVAQYSTDGSIIASWCSWTAQAAPEYRVLPDGNLLVFNRVGDGPVEAAVMDEAGEFVHSGRLGPGVSDVAVLDDGSVIVAHDRYFRDGENTILGISRFDADLNRTAVADGAGFLAAKLSAADGVSFWNRNSSLIVSSERHFPIWTGDTAAGFGPNGPIWVLNTPGSDRWTLVGSYDDNRRSSSVLVVVGIVDNGVWTTESEFSMTSPYGQPHQATKLSCGRDTIHWCVGRQWYSIPLDALHSLQW